VLQVKQKLPFAQHLHCTAVPMSVQALPPGRIRICLEDIMTCQTPSSITRMFPSTLRGDCAAEAGEGVGVDAVTSLQGII
jgi:hypothetical protein